MGTKTLLSVEDFAALPDGEDYELVDGELVPLPGGSPRHFLFCLNVVYALKAYLTTQAIGVLIIESDCLTFDGRVRRPDIGLFLNDRFANIDLDRVPLPYPPDIAVEVLSPSEGAMGTNAKALEYLAGGSREVWLIDPENREVRVDTGAQVRRFRESEILETPVLPGFAVRVANLLETPVLPKPRD